MQRFHLGGLRVSLIALVLIAVIPSLALMLYTGLEERRTADEHAHQTALQLVLQAAATQDLLIESTRQLLIGLARLPEVRQADPAACAALFADILKQNPLYANFIVVKPNGDLWCSATPFSGAVNYADRAWFTSAWRTRDFVAGGYVIGRMTRRPLATFAYPVLDAEGDLQMIVAAGMDLGWLNDLVAQIDLPAGSVLTVIDDNGVVLARNLEPEKWVGQTAPDTPVVQAILARREQGVVEAAGIDGVGRLYAFASLGDRWSGVNAYVTVGIPAAVVHARANQILARNLAALGLATVLALAAAWAGGEYFLMRRINVLLAATRRLAAGDLSARTGIPYGAGELSQLARAFDQMAESLAQHTAERERAVEALQRSEDIFRSTIAQASEGILLADERGVIVEWNEEQERIFGRSRAEMIGKPLWDFQFSLLPQSAQNAATYARLKAAILQPDERVRQSMSQPREIAVVCPDGALKTVQFTVFPITTVSGRLYGAFSRDITEQKHAEAMLVQQLQILTSLYACAQKLAESLDLEAVADAIAHDCVEIFGARLAWLGRAEPDGRVRVLSHYPQDAPYLRQINVRWDETPEGQGPTGRAIRSGFPQSLFNNRIT